MVADMKSRPIYTPTDRLSDCNTVPMYIMRSFVHCRLMLYLGITCMQINNEPQLGAQQTAKAPKGLRSWR